ncbi:MAG: peptide MFS transporter [Myxococcaceae bacterium]
MTPTPTAASTSTASAEAFGKAPAGVYWLAATETWERLSYYGMRALLVLYMVDASRGGLGMNSATALRLYAVYTGGVYLTTLAGGALADRWLGERRAIVLGGSLMMLGHLALALSGMVPFFCGLLLLMLGSGLFKPNISSLVGALYAPGDARREAGFTIFYMGINLGAFFGPMLCGTLGERVNWHLGFGIAALGMAIGLAVFLSAGPALAGLGRTPRRAGEVAVRQPLTRAEWQRVMVLVVLTAFAMPFWAAFEQAGGLVNLYTEQRVDRTLLGFVVPATWFQAVNPILIWTMGPLFAWVWLRLVRRPGGGPTTAAKVAFGLLGMAAGMLFLVWAAQVTAQAGVQAPLSLILGYYVLSTAGELCLSPVALSAVTRVAPPQVTSRMMGVWFISLAGGNFLAGLVGSLAPHVGEFVLFSGLCAAVVVAGVGLLALSPLLVRWTHGTDALQAGDDRQP